MQAIFGTIMVKIIEQKQRGEAVFFALGYFNDINENILSTNLVHIYISTYLYVYVSHRYKKVGSRSITLSQVHNSEWYNELY